VTVPGLVEFLHDYPGMGLLPITGPKILIEGEFQFCAAATDRVQIVDSYRLRVTVPDAFPADLPVVEELGSKIPRKGAFHVNRDGTLCLGSPLRLLLRLSNRPTLPGFASECLVPYLYAVSHKLQFGGALPFSELDHDRPGELRDYMDLFSLARPDQAEQVIRLLAMKKRRANKLPCPCDCGRRLGKCRFNRRIRRFRKLASRSWFRKHL
jgi:hypothetical protein